MKYQWIEKRTASELETEIGCKVKSITRGYLGEEPDLRYGIEVELEDETNQHLGKLDKLFDNLKREGNPIIPPRSTHVSVLTAVNASAVRPARIKRVWEGNDYYFDCFVTQTVRDEYASGKIVLGDFVLVHFDDVGEQCVTAKVFKSW